MGFLKSKRRLFAFVTMVFALVAYVWWGNYATDRGQALIVSGMMQILDNGRVKDELFATPPRNDHLIDPIPPTLHYLWCGEKKFTFRHYLGLLSALKILRPMKLMFHYTHKPQTDDYNTWFNTINTDVPGIELHQLPKDKQCGSRDLLNTTLGFMSKHGGVFIGSSVMLGHPPKVSPAEKAWFAAPTPLKDKTQLIVIAQGGFDTAKQEQYIKKIESSPKGCVGVDSYSYTTNCVLLEKDFNPRDIIYAETAFGELARWVFYGSSKIPVVEQDPSNPIPRISHFVKMENKVAFPYSELYKGELTFIHWLNILSALYVGGFHHVYVHAQEKPRGYYWDELAKENVTYVPLDELDYIYQQRIGSVQHKSDIMRYMILNKYGGVYQDFDVTWASRVPDYLMNYPTVVSMEWTRQPKSEFPESFNLGVYMSRPDSPWLRRHIETNKHYIDGDWGYNVIRMSYRTWELYPDLVYVDRHLQVMCFAETELPVICHPSWDKGYVRSIHDHRKTREMTNWREEIRAFHMTKPKPHPSMASLEAVAKGKDIFADVARNVLQKSGREHMLPK